VDERPVPPSHVFGERASPTQPVNRIIAALSPQTFSLDDAWGPTPADRDACLAQLQTMRNDGAFTPPSLEGTIVMPSNIGGAHWGGVALDPERQLAIVPVNRIVSFVQLIPLDRVDTAEARRNQDRLGDQYTRMHGTPFVMRRRFLLSPSKLPCSKPPFGSLVAIDLRTGAKRWDVTLGDLAAITKDATPRPSAPRAAGSELGAVNLGGPMITAGGVVFVAATLDHALRAFDVETGRKLWEAPLPAGGRATPMTYQVSRTGKQYIVIAAGGGEEFGNGDHLIAFALP
jgi:quinoprotein glucose dehydrogenase